MGFFIDNKMESIGMDETVKKTYLGEYKSNLKHGVGSCSYANGAKYIG